MATTAEKGVVLERLASHLPDLVVHRSSFPAVPETVNKYGVLLFGDVSGFTALCEQYCNNSHSKKKGTDQLTSTLNLYLSKIVQAILEDGGDILKFAGDALLAHWPCNRPDANSVIQYLIKKSLVMQKKFDNFQTPDDVLLRFKIALSVGKAHIHFIGNQEYRTFDITGPAVDEVTIAQSVAKPGTVVVTRVAWEMCNQELYTADVLEHGFMLISDAREDRENIVNHDQFIKLINRPLRAVNDDILESNSKSSRLTMRKETEVLLQNMSAEAEDCLRTYILKTVKHKVDHGYDVSWLSELRQVSVLFINLDPDFSLPTDIVSRKTKEQTLLQTAFESIYPNLVKYNGTLNKIFMFDKGCTFLCIFGLPYASHEDDPERALKAAQAIFNALDNIRLSHYSIGVTTGVAFCGVVGHQERHEYTVIGDKVNMAARLMTKFPDGLTCDDTTRLKSTLPQETFILAPPVKLKGIPTPEDIYFVSTDENENQLGEEKSEIYESNDYESLVGRKAEMERFLIELQHMTEQTQRNPGAIIISGSGGIGKTKLLRAMKSKASSMGIRVVSGTGGLIEQNTPFYTVKTLLTRLLGLDACVNVHDKEQQILQNVTDEKMRKCLPLLNDLLSLKFPQTSFTLQMSHKERRANLHKLLFSIVHKEALSKPCIFGIDDAHRMDQDSWAFFLDLALDSDAVLILASRAIPERDRTPVMAKIFSHPTTIRFRLEGLSSEETASFVCQLLNVQEVDKNLLNVLYSRSHGSPLWCEELVDRMLGSGVLQIVEYNKVIEEKLGYTRVSVGINETRTSVVRSFKQKKCVINETMGIEDIPMPESMAGIVLTRIDNMSPSEQMVLKCAAILGHTFHRKMLQAILPTSSLESFDESLNSLAEAGIIECFVALHIERYDSKVHNHLSGIDIDVNHLECSCMESRRADPAPRLAHQNVNIHSLEKCQLLQFVHTYIQETAVSLWTESQLQSLHETAALYLESEAHKCSSCGGGSFMITAGSSKKRTKQVDGHVNRRRRRRFSMETKVTHFIRDLTRRTQRRSTVASSVTHRVSMVHSDNDINIDDNDPESIDPIQGESTDPVHRGSIDPIRRESTDPVHRESIDPIRRESTDPVHRGSIDPIRRESTDPVHRGSIDSAYRESIAPVHRVSVVPVHRVSIVADVIEESSDEPSIHNTTKRVSIVSPDNDRTRRSSSIVPSVIQRISLDNEIEPLDNIRSVIEPLQEEEIRGTEAAPNIDFQNCHCDEVLADVYPHLVYHWKLAGNKAKTLHYLIEAAVASLVTFNNMEAISLLEEAEQAVCDGDIGDEDFGELQIAKLQSLFGQAYFQSGEINECLLRIQKALGVLDSRVPTNKIGVVGNFIWQACKQYLHNKFPQRYMQRKQDTESDMYLEKSRCMSQIVNVYHLQHKSLHAFVAALSQLNIAEEAQEDIHELLTAYAAVIECCQKFNYKRIGDVYIKKSLALCYCTEFGIDDLSTCAHLLNVALNMKLCSGKLAEARDIGKMVIRLTSKIHLDTLKLVALPLLFFANLLTLRKDDCEENLKQLQEIAKKTDNFRTRALHDCCRFDALLELGLNSDREDAIAMDTKKVYCSGDSYHYDDTEKFFITSCIALWHSRGQSAYASTFTDMARSLYLPDFETFFTVQSLAKYLECILEQYLTEQDNRQFRQESEKDLKKLKSLLGRFPMFRGRYFHLQAMYYYARKKKGKAQCSLKKALSVGEELSCPLDIQRAESTLQSWFPSSKS